MCAQDVRAAGRGNPSCPGAHRTPQGAPRHARDTAARVCILLLVDHTVAGRVHRGHLRRILNVLRSRQSGTPLPPQQPLTHRAQRRVVRDVREDRDLSC
jgi:hypothetical protein